MVLELETQHELDRKQFDLHRERMQQSVYEANKKADNSIAEIEERLDNSFQMLEIDNDSKTLQHEKVVVLHNKATKPDKKISAVIELANDRMNAIKKMRDDLESTKRLLRERESNDEASKTTARGIAIILGGLILSNKLKQSKLGIAFGMWRQFTRLNRETDDERFESDRKISRSISYDLDAKIDSFSPESHDKQEDLVRLEEMMKTGSARLLAQIMDRKDCVMTARAFRKWLCVTSSAHAVENQMSIVEEMANQLETTREKLVILKSHIGEGSRGINTESVDSLRNDAASLSSPQDQKMNESLISRLSVLKTLNNGFWDVSDSESEESPRRME